jgi:hypothetical protein
MQKFKNKHMHYLKSFIKSVHPESNRLYAAYVS